jgi:hypothetical protein
MLDMVCYLLGRGPEEKKRRERAGWLESWMMGDERREATSDEADRRFAERKTSRIAL